MCVRCHVSTLSGAGYWRPSSLKTRTRLFYMANTMVVDYLIMQGVLEVLHSNDCTDNRLCFIEWFVQRLWLARYGNFSLKCKRPLSCSAILILNRNAALPLLNALTSKQFCRCCRLYSMCVFKETFATLYFGFKNLRRLFKRHFYLLGIIWLLML